MPGKFPYGEKVDTLAGTTETIDLRKSGRVFAGTVTGACVLTLSNAPEGYTELTFILTNPHSNFDIAGALWAAGTLPTFTQTGVDILKMGVYRDGDTTVIYETGLQQAQAADT